MERVGMRWDEEVVGAGMGMGMGGVGWEAKKASDIPEPERVPFGQPRIKVAPPPRSPGRPA